LQYWAVIWWYAILIKEQKETQSTGANMADVEAIEPAGGSRELDDSADVMEDALGAVRAYLGMEVAFISEFKFGQRIFRFVDAAPDAPLLRPGDSAPLDESYCLRVVDGRLPELIQEASEIPEAASLPITADLPVRSHISVPVTLSNGAVFGTFCCFTSNYQARISDQDLSVMRLFADFVGRQIERHSRQVAEYQGVRRLIEQTIRERSFASYFQPIVDIEGRASVGFEALARFDSQPYRSPDQWFSDAQSVDLGIELELAAICKALSNLALLPDGIYISLNVSPATILHGNLAAVLRGFPLDRIVLEITEHAVIDNYLGLQRVLRPLRRAGLMLAIDDVGAGHSSFRHILILKPDIIKLDMSIIRNLNRKMEQRALCAALIRFAKETGCRVVAEGVETNAELETLRSLEVKVVQGYLTGRPMPADGVLRQAPARVL
jgi:EAL domain-containing protein (putative c-di-GMP-specific phosphodiesterase class I)